MSRRCGYADGRGTAAAAGVPWPSATHDFNARLYPRLRCRRRAADRRALREPTHRRNRRRLAPQRARRDTHGH
eukprot:5159887-Pleurochrysis_carterae.AAC.1